MISMEFYILIIFILNEFN